MVDVEFDAAQTFYHCFTDSRGNDYSEVDGEHVLNGGSVQDRYASAGSPSFPDPRVLPVYLSASVHCASPNFGFGLQCQGNWPNNFMLTQVGATGAITSATVTKKILAFADTYNVSVRAHTRHVSHAIPCWRDEEINCLCHPCML